MDYYKGDGTFNGTYWWQAGETFTSLLNYQHVCGDSVFQDDIYKGILSQAGENFDFEPSSQLGNIGNDDIGSWALTAMQAAEMGFKDPSEEGQPTWAQMAKNAYELLYGRWDSGTCNGGLRWQFDDQKSSWEYKATIANGNLFQLGARLARFTGQSEYQDQAESIYDWISGAGLTNDLEYGTEVYDGFNANTNCTDTVKVLWTYNYGVLLGGSAYMFDVTQDSKWSDRMDNIITGSQILYSNSVLYERACELYDICNEDQKIFKGVYLRYLGFASRLVSDATNRIMDLIGPTASAVASSCSGGDQGTACGLKWTTGGYDGSSGLQEQVSALEALVNQVAHFSSAMNKQS